MRPLGLWFLAIALVRLPATQVPAAQERPGQASVGGTVYAPHLRLAGAVVYLIPRKDTTFAPPEERPVIDQVNLRFLPATLSLIPGTTVEFRNSDPVLHNVFGPAELSEEFDLGTYPRREQRSHTFASQGAHVVLCKVHPEMVAYVLVVPTPYRSGIDAAGDFYIRNVPAGRYTVHVWHPQIETFSTALTIGKGVSEIRLKLEIAR